MSRDSDAVSEPNTNKAIPLRHSSQSGIALYSLFENKQIFYHEHRNKKVFV